MTLSDRLIIPLRVETVHLNELIIRIIHERFIFAMSDDLCGIVLFFSVLLSDDSIFLVLLLRDGLGRWAFRSSMIDNATSRLL